MLIIMLVIILMAHTSPLQKMDFTPLTSSPEIHQVLMVILVFLSTINNMLMQEDRNRQSCYDIEACEE